MKFQTLIYQASYEYLPNNSYVVILTSSSSFYNSSFAPNIIGQHKILPTLNPDGTSRHTILHFLTCVSPVLCHTLQFIDRVDTRGFNPSEVGKCLRLLKTMPYFDRSLKSLRLRLECGDYFDDDDKNQNGNDDKEEDAFGIKWTSSRYIFRNLDQFQSCPYLEDVHLSIRTKSNSGRSACLESDDDEEDSPQSLAIASLPWLTALWKRKHFPIKDLNVVSEFLLPDDFYADVFGAKKSVLDNTQTLRSVKIRVNDVPIGPISLSSLRPSRLTKVAPPGSPSLLERVELHRVQIDKSYAFFLGSLPCLKYFHLTSISQLDSDDTVLNAFTDGFMNTSAASGDESRRLEELLLQDVSGIKESTLAKLIQETKVSKLTLRDTRCSSEVIAKCDLVEHFVFCGSFAQGLPSLNPCDTTKHMTNLKNFKNLSSNGSSRGDWEFFYYLGSTETLTKLQTKVYLQPKQFHDVFSRFRKLETLQIDLASQLSEDLLTSKAGRALGNLPELKNLSISGLRFECEFIRGILGATQSIEHLTLSMTFAESEEFVPAAFSSVPSSLHTLDLIYSHEMYANRTGELDIALLHDVIACLPSSLHQVNIIQKRSGGPFVRNDELIERWTPVFLGLRALARKFPNVRFSWPSLALDVRKAEANVLWKKEVPSMAKILREARVGGARLPTTRGRNYF